MECPKPSEMREVIEKIAKDFDWDDRKREVLWYMMGYYGIDGDDEK